MSTLTIHHIPPFIEYTDTDGEYVPPVQMVVNESVPMRVYCNHSGCNKYIKGILGYNGGFTAETGQTADLRNQVWTCTEHD
jgi:hypothetical protein